jgi:translation initiation factor 1 (eIF-1/SUI1)
VPSRLAFGHELKRAIKSSVSRSEVELVQIIEMKRVPGEIKPVTEFLRDRIKGSVIVKGSQIEIEGASRDEIKQLLHKFLHQRGLTNHKVHSQPSFIEIIPHDSRHVRKGTKGRPPTAPETMPYFFPGR